MKADAQRWLGPGEAAAELGVSVKALRVYEREGLVKPARTEGGWRAYGPEQIARIHLVLVLRDLGLPLKAVRALLEGRTPSLAMLLLTQQEALEAQQRRIGGALRRLRDARLKLAQGLDLTPDDLATLARETVMQTQSLFTELDERIQGFIERHLPPPEVEAIKAGVIAQAAAQGRSHEDLKTESLILMAEARRLMALDQPDSEAAKAMLRRWKSVTAGITKPAAETQAAWRRGMQEAMADPALGPELPFDPAVLAFIKRVGEGMKARGELPEG